MTTKNFDNHPSGKNYYTQTSKSNSVCMYFDSASPIHCSEDKSCSKEAIQISDRILTDPHLRVEFQGWIDPFPVNKLQASKIRSFSLSVHDTKEVDSKTLNMNEKALDGMTFNVSGHYQDIILPSKQPGLYGIVLEVVDNAGNPKMARRFVMFDNSSTIRIRGDKVLRATTADHKTNFTWQTNLGKVCLSWQGRYYNSYNVHYNLLRRIKQDYHGFFSGVYEQTTGVLHVSGTPNVAGIVEYRYNWTKIGSSLVNNNSKISIPKVTDEGFCGDFKIADGETLIVSISSIDIMRRTLVEDITIFIDSSVADITDISLVKDGLQQLFIHNSTEMHKMVLEFSILDGHSGIYSIEWSLGTTQHGIELGTRAIGVQRLSNVSSCFIFVSSAKYSVLQNKRSRPFYCLIHDMKCLIILVLKLLSLIFSRKNIYIINLIYV